MMNSWKLSVLTGWAFVMRFFHVTEFRGDIVNLDFHALAWEPRENLPAYDFLEGDVEFVKRLAGIA